MKTKIILSVLLVFLLVSVSIGLADEIHVSVENGDFEKIKALVDYNPTTMNAKDDRSCTPLHFAAETGHKEIAEFLLANGAVIDVREINSNTPLHYESMNVKVALTELLLTNGAGINAQNKDQFSSLHLRQHGINGNQLSNSLLKQLTGKLWRHHETTKFNATIIVALFAPYNCSANFTMERS